MKLLLLHMSVGVEKGFLILLRLSRFLVDHPEEERRSYGRKNEADKGEDGPER